MNFTIYNTMSREIEPFIPIHNNNVGMYCCGPTVYNYAHIGNLRTYIFEDILHRVITYNDYHLTHVMNITDVGHLSDDGDEGEDKMVKRSKESGKSVYDIAAMYTKAFFEDTASLNIITPDITPRATEHIEQMINLIKTLEQKGHTYVSGGNVYFSIDTFPSYGKLARLNLEKVLSRARTEVDTNKKNPKDFVLWFTKSKFENQAMQWPSPWGVGYPGWHIECSAMSMHYLGESFDIHTGGIDHVNVHHTNEIAQSEGATDKEWVKYWVHGEFLINETGKMSKSKGEFLTISLLREKGYEPLDFRYFCLLGHYRSQLVFSWQSLDAARSGRKNLIKLISQLKVDTPKTVEEITDTKALSYVAEFREHINTDMHLPQALATLWKIVKDTDLSDEDKKALVDHMETILALSLVCEKKDEEIPQEISVLLEKRAQAKLEKNYQTADDVRAIVENMGYVIKDTKNGPIITKIV